MPSNTPSNTDSNTPRGDDTTPSQLPPSPIRHHKFNNGDITVKSRYAKYIPGDPDRLYLFAARALTAYDTTITPPHNSDDTHHNSELRGYYIGNDENLVVYFLENWGDEAVIGFEPCYAIIELHELTHWAVPLEDNEQGPDHWENWNAVLTNVVEYVMDIDTLQPGEYTPDTTPSNKNTPNDDPGTTQLTLTEY